MVVDTSVAFKWFVEEPGSQAARRLIGETPLEAPDFLLAELLNALWVAAGQRRFDPADTVQAVSVTEQAIDLVPCDRLAESAMQMAISLKHPVYDCLFLAAATEMSTMLVTADGRFHGAVSDSRWAANIALLDAD